MLGDHAQQPGQATPLARILPDNLFRYEFRIPRVTRASGVGGPIDKIEIPPDSPAYDEIIRNCDLGRIPPAVCQHLTGYTPGG